MHGASNRRGLTKKNCKCKCVFRLHMDKLRWTLKPRKSSSHHSKHHTNAHLLKQHVQMEAVSFLADSGVRLNSTQSAAFVTDAGREPDTVTLRDGAKRGGRTTWPRRATRLWLFTYLKSTESSRAKLSLHIYCIKKWRENCNPQGCSVCSRKC